MLPPDLWRNVPTIVSTLTIFIKTKLLYQRFGSGVMGTMAAE
jgi:hypothetical protein